MTNATTASSWDSTLGLRGNLDEGERFGLPGTYLAGFYEKRSLPYAEPGYGDPEDGQTVLNVANGEIIRLVLYGHGSRFATEAEWATKAAARRRSQAALRSA